MTILYSEPVMATAWYVPFLVCCLLICVVICVISMMEDWYLVGTLSCIMAIVIFFTLIVVSKMGLDEVETERERYEVILDDTYSAATLYANYEVIEQRGQIWVIEDKE